MKRFFAVIAILALFNSTAWALWANPNPQGGGDTAGQLLLKHESNMTDIYTGANGKLNLLKANFSGTSAPSSPDEGQAWFDSTHLTISIYNGSAWIPFASFNKGNTGPTGSWNAPTIYSPTTTGTDSGVETLTNKSLTNPIISNTPLTFPSSTTQGGIYRDITGYSFVVPAGQSANVVSNAYYGNSSWRYIGTGIASLISASDTISGGNVCRAPSGTAGAPISWTCSPIATNNSVFGSQNVVTGSRALGTVYQNTTGKTMMVTISAEVTGSTGTQGMIAYTDSTPSPSTIVAEGATTANSSYGKFITITFMVLPNNYYSVNSGGVATISLAYWVEWH